MFKFLLPKKKIEKKSDLTPKGVIRSCVPSSYLKDFPHNDLKKIGSKETTYIN